jgi:hypothetical protein
MRSSILFLAVVLTCSFFTANAQASRGEYGEERYEHGERYEGRGYYDDGGRRYEESKFYGQVEAMPQGGRDGIWRISGRDVVVSQNTYIKEEYGRIGLGAQVEVKGGGNPFSAYEIEVKSGSRAMGNAPVMSGIKFYGPVEVMPQGGFLGSWRIGGRDVLVTQQTYIKQQYGPLTVGAQVEVKGGGNPFTASELEVKSSVMR